MRVKILASGGNVSTGLGVNGGTLGGPLILVANPIDDMEAATKNYIDMAVTSLNANNLTSGTINISRMPALSGDLTKAIGNSTFTLAASGVTAGTYPKVVVDSKGRVTSGAVLASADIPSLDWSKIGTGKPTTLSGYGIGDSISLSGATLTGFLILHANPTSALHAATKGYVDSALSAASGLAVGDVIRKPYTTTPSGFLKCNGAYISQSTYSGLFAVIGNTFDVSTGLVIDYTSYGAVGSGKPHKQLYNINNNISVSITGWSATTSLPGSLIFGQVIVTKNRVYILGGNINANDSAVVYTTTINTDGSLGSWTTGTSLPATVSYSQAVVTKNRVYLMGGNVNGSRSSTVYTAPINADGTLGTWTTGPSLPGILTDSQAIVTMNRVYLLGGRNTSSFTTVVYTALINTDGTLGTWSTGTPLPVNSAHASQVVVTKNRVYLLGLGVNGGEVYTTSINSNGTLGSWVVGVTITDPIQYSQAIVTKNSVYLLGGTVGGIATSNVYIASIEADGTLGNWVRTGVSLPSALYYSEAIVTKNRVYLLGGKNSSNVSIATVYTASIDSCGLNDYSAYYNGTINFFDGTSPSATTNPSPTTQFGLPDYSTLDTSYIPGTYSYIKT